MILGKKKKKILIIDDEADFANTVKLSLERTGEFEVKTENKGSEGHITAKEFRPDLILLDVMMPDADGGDVADRIRADITLKDTPIIFLTGAVTKDETVSMGGVSAGYPILAKPVAAEDLLRCIRNNLGR